MKNKCGEKAEARLRPDVLTQAQFKRKMPPATYREGQHPARKKAGRAIARIVETKAAGRELRMLSRPLLNWAGNALSFDVRTLPLSLHERPGTKAIIETLVGRRKDRQLNVYNRSLR